MDWEMKARMLAQAVEELAWMLGVAGALIVAFGESWWAIAGGVLCVLVAVNGLSSARIGS